MDLALSTSKRKRRDSEHSLEQRPARLAASPLPTVDIGLSSTSQSGLIAPSEGLQAAFPLPDLDRYLILVQQHLPPGELTPCVDLIHSLHHSFQAGLQPKVPEAIVDTATWLHGYPRLLYGLSSIIRPWFRLECSTTVESVNSFLLVDGIAAQTAVLSFIPDDGCFKYSFNEQDVLQLLLETQRWDKFLQSNMDSQQLGCIAEVLQHTLDAGENNGPLIRTRLDELAKHCVLPTSSFVHFVDKANAQPSLYEPISSVGGGQCDVHHIKVNRTSLCFRVARWPHESGGGANMTYRRFCREVAVWKQLKHANILPLLGATTELFPTRPCFILPWMANGSLIRYLKEHPEHDKLLAISQIVDGVKYLHTRQPPVAHKDLKGSNVVLGPDLVCMLTDFGLSGLLYTNRTATAGNGTQFWMAPEIFDPEAQLSQDSCPRDIYSLGCTIAEILRLEAPQFIWHATIRGQQPRIPPPGNSGHPSEGELWSVVKNCVEVNPQGRPDILQVKCQLETPKGCGAPPPNPVGFPDVINAYNVPLEYKKEGSDWFALFNTKVKRVLDVTLVHTFMHKSVVCCVRFSADGKYLATGCNRTAHIYDVKTGHMTCMLVHETVDKASDLYIRSVCFSPNGKYLATGGEDKVIRIWDIAKRRIRTIFDGHQQEVFSLDFSLDGRILVSGSSDNTARIWDMHDGTSKVLTTNDPASSNDIGVTSIAISPDGRYVAAGHLDSVVRIWDVNTAQLVEMLRGHKDSVYSVAFTLDGKGLVSGSLDKTLKHWDVSGLSSAKGKKEGQNGGAVSVPGGSRDDKPSQCTMTFSGHKNYVLSVAVSHDGQWIVSGSKDRGVQFWDAQNGVVQCVVQGHKNSVIFVDLSPAGNVLATGSGDWQARIWSYTK